MKNIIYNMKLVDFAFKAIKKGEKDIEVRLNDEKRSKIKIGDTIIFRHLDTDEILEAKVINLHKFNTFEELFNRFDYKRIGVKKNDTYRIMDNFYSKEEQEKYGALGIEIELI